MSKASPATAAASAAARASPDRSVTPISTASRMLAGSGTSPASASSSPRGPVLTELVKPVAGVDVVQRGISVENIAIAVGLDDQELLARVMVAQEELNQDGTLQQLRRKWLGNPYTDQSLAVL